MSGELLEAARAAIARGFRIFPLVPGGRTPAIKEWQIKATSDPAVVERVWGAADYNIGILTTGMIVLDADVKGGRKGLETLAGLGIDLNTYTVETPSGGRHAYFTGPDVRNSVQSLGPGLDVRGDRGFVVGAGSCTDAGTYRVRDGGVVQPVADALRARVLDLAAAAGRDKVSATDVGRVSNALEDAPEAIALATAYLLDRAPLATQGSRSDTMYRVACFVRDFGISEDVAVDLMMDHWNERCSPPADIDDMKYRVGNAYAYGENAPGSKSPAHWFEGIDLDPPAAPALIVDLLPFDTYDPDAHEDLQDDPWLFYKVAPATGVLVLVGPSGGGKSFLLIKQAHCLATGGEFFGVPPDDRGGTAFCYSGTEGSGFKRRVAALCRDKRLPITSSYIANLRAEGAIERLYYSLKAQNAWMVKEHGVPLRMVVIETLSTSGLIVDENNAAECSAAAAVLAGLSRRLGVLVVVSHHPPKEKGGLRGSGAILAAVDYVIEVVRQPGHKVREVELVKARSAEERALGSFSLVSVILGQDSRGRPNETMTASLGEPTTPLARKAAHTDKLIEAIELVLTPDGDADQEEVGQMFASMARGAGNRRTQFKSAYEYAMATGLIDLVNVSGRPTFRKRII